MNMRRTAFAVALLAAGASLPAHGQHAGHEGHHAHSPQPSTAPASKQGAQADTETPAQGAVDHAAHHATPRASADHAAMDHAAMDHAAHDDEADASADHATHHGTHHAATEQTATQHAATHRAAHHAEAHASKDHAAHHATHDSATDHAAHHAATHDGGHRPDDASAHTAMDHAGMHEAPATAESPSADTHANPPSHRPGAASTHAIAPTPPGTDRDLPPDAAPRTPIPALTDADRAAAFPPGLHGHATHDRRIHAYALVDRLEWQDGDEGALAWEGVAWIGGDIHRLWLRSEGEAVDGSVEGGHLDLLYSRSLTPWWDVVAGLRQDLGEGPRRTWAAIGLQGLAPWKFEVEASVYIGASGRTAASLEAEYDTLLTNRLILQWRAGLDLQGRDDPARGLASGASGAEAGARLRYEVSRRFAPYVGLEWHRALGGTADLHRARGDKLAETRVVAGIRFWF